MGIFERFKKKPPLYALKVLIKYIKLNLPSRSDYSYSLWSNNFYDSNSGELYIVKLTKLINFVSELKKDEIIQIIDLFENENLKHQLKELFIKISELSPLVIEQIPLEKRSNGKYFLGLHSRKLLDEYLKCIVSLVELEDIIFKEIELDKYLLSQDHQIGSFLGSGSNSKAYQIKNHPELVLVISKDFSMSQFRSEKKKQLASSKIDSRIGFAKILQVGILDNKIARVMQRAPGKPLHTNIYRNYQVWLEDMQILANAPQEHYNKLVEDVIELLKFGIGVDVSKSDNIFYDTSKGFTIIDPILIKEPKYFSLIDPLCNYYRFGKDLTQEGIELIIRICDKLLVAGDLDTEEIAKMRKFALSKSQN